MASNTPVQAAEGSSVPDDSTRYRIRATIYGQCSGDAIGLLTEFLSKEESEECFKSVSKELEYEHKSLAEDFHRMNWEVGDWTDDSDQMLLILLSIIENEGKVDHIDFAKRLKKWTRRGFPELGDMTGNGLGRTTSLVIDNLNFEVNPHAVAYLVWDKNDRALAPNGAVMRTSILGVHDYTDLTAVKQNALAIGKTTHADPRCQASVVAVSVAIAMMLQRQPRHVEKNGSYNVKRIIDDSYEHAHDCLETKDQKKEFLKFLKCKKIKELKLDEENKIGYTYKTLGTGFWALKQDNFRDTIQKIVMEGGDADTNACVAGAMLGCKLGCDAIPASWKDKLLHKGWLDNIIQRYFKLMGWTSDS